MNKLPIDQPLPSSVVAWAHNVIKMLLQNGTLSKAEPKDDAQLKLCGTGRDAITGLPILICRSRLADGPVMKIISLDPVSGNMHRAVLSLNEFKAYCPDSYRDCEAAITGDANTKHDAKSFEGNRS